MQRTASIMIWGFVLLAAVFITACSSPPPPPPAPRVERFEREYPVNEEFEIYPDRVVQGEKTATVISSEKIESTYGTRKRTWLLQEDISSLPQFSSPEAPIYEALYNMALEESLQDIRSDGSFMAGKKWNGVWTRDISYAIQLSLAYVLPENSLTSLMAKVNEYGEIIQDTGTGGSWPISTDRIVWAIAAWELYLATGDAQWLDDAREILQRSIQRDTLNALDRETGLLFGETSFLDWREQTYPEWMEPKDIYESKAMSTNLLHARALEILSYMYDEAGDSPMSMEYFRMAERQYRLIADAFRLENGLYSLYLYPPIQGSRPVDKTGTLSNSLAAILAAEQDSPAAVLGGEISLSTEIPVVHFGIPTIEPQQPGIPPYHNKGIWPFVEAYYGIAGVREGNLAAFSHSLEAMTRSAALFLSHMENMVYDNGHYSGTEINSERQLWSVAGYLGMVYRGLFGINVQRDGVTFAPMLPENLGGGPVTLSGFTLRGMELNMTVRGTGSRIASMQIDGEPADPRNILQWRQGPVQIDIVLEQSGDSGSINLIASDIEAPKDPLIQDTGSNFSYRSLQSDARSFLWNGRERSPMGEAGPGRQGRGDIWSVLSTREGENRTLHSNLSRWTYDPDSVLRTPAGDEAVEIVPDPEQILEFSTDVEEDGRFYIVFEYANGSGPINTNNKTAIRTLFADEQRQGAIILPQRGERKWDDFGLSSGLFMNLEQGSHTFQLRYLPENRNMDGEVNRALIRSMLLIPVN
ncbi:Six-hairpin glycosidase-like protein [Salinispira pacifica]|uniref:Six-hairpin glycosidase-like protein n=1 Tax=Salinispira pacifica TaxID=1307761 RepID=V5WEH1_9SPIO|nr:Six-hairpin glycosidase-like protein [Salinispira pacifica]AHC13551.1 Six-hairpin glycosidase-like protein [Salinispira pacifica]